MKLQDFNALPLSVREDAKDTLRAFNEVHITFSNGEYHVSTGIALLGRYPEDYKVIGDVSRDDIYTADEQIVNYIESFHNYPHNYKGSRDYNMLHYMADRRRNGEECKVKLVDGTARLIV